MPTIHPSAVVETDSIGDGVTIGEFSIVRPGAVLSDGVTIHPHAIVDANVEIGAGTEVLPGAYLGRRPRAVGAVTRIPTFRERLSIGPGCSIGAHTTLYYDADVGGNTLIGDRALLRETAQIGNGCVVGIGAVINGNVHVGDGSSVMLATSLAAKTRVGKGVFISPGVITTNDNAMGVDGWVEEEAAGAIIEDEARVGTNATLLPGVTIGRGAIVGAGSVVTRDVEPGVRVLGVPARPA